MATPSQIRANRANALRSSGPRTEAGREIAKMNALKHGLAAKELVIQQEDPAALDALRADLIAEHQPVGQTESLLVEDLAVCWWRLQRARKYETEALKGTFMANHPFVLTVMERLLRYTTAAERGWNRAQANLRTAQNDRRKREASNTQSAPSPQPQETDKVMAIGSVPQNDPESVEQMQERDSGPTAGCCPGPTGDTVLSDETDLIPAPGTFVGAGGCAIADTH